jgi:AbrB family looped-hinge helix DNA binding protein
MKLAKSRLTSQGQVSVPAEVRRRLGLAPGSILEWGAEGDAIVVRRGHRYSSEDVHSTLFPDGTPALRSLRDLKEGIGRNVARRHARR